MLLGVRVEVKVRVKVCFGFHEGTVSTTKKKRN